VEDKTPYQISTTNWLAVVWIRNLPRASVVCYYGSQVTRG